jgi:hypothetical protein
MMQYTYYILVDEVVLLNYMLSASLVFKVPFDLVLRVTNNWYM